MSGLPWVIRDDNGAVAAMWLSVFRSWLLRLQEVFDDEWKRGFLNKDGWKEGASADGILAWKLAVQTGHVDHPVDVTQVCVKSSTQIFRVTKLQLYANDSY